MEFDNIIIPWDGWEVVSHIGEGGYGTVYKIKSVKSGVTDYAALKVIRIPSNTTEHRQIVKDFGSTEKAKAYYIRQKDEFLSEIEILKQFKGTGNIVYIENWDVRELDDGYSWEIYIQMELLTSLDKKIADKGLPSEEEIIKIGKDICTALKRCESKNIVHRDIKPENILVNEFEDYKLGDFGIARNLVSTTTLTGIGARPYMAPEVANYKKAGKSIDIYSLGIVLYELLNNNRLPFINAEGDFTLIEKGRAIYRRLDGERIPAPAHGSEDLKRIVLKACEYDPKDRYENASAMLKDLDSLNNRPREANKSTGIKAILIPLLIFAIAFLIGKVVVAPQLMTEEEQTDNNTVEYQTKDIVYNFEDSVGEYHEDNEYAYNTLCINSTDADKIYFDISFYRLLSSLDIVATATSDNSASFDDGNGISGTLIFGNDNVTVVLDEVENFYSDMPLSEFVSGLNHTFVKVD